MRDKLLIVGAGGFGRVVLEHAVLEYDCAFIDDGPEIGTLVNEVPVIGRTTELGKFSEEYKKLIVAIGNNKFREEVYKRAEAAGYEFPNIIDPSAYISPYATLGKGVIILNNAVVQNNAKIGNGTILNSGVEAHHDSVIGNYCLIYANSVVRALTNVGDRVRIGSNVSVSTGAQVPDDADIEDGSVVSGSTAKGPKATGSTANSSVVKK